MEPSLFDEFTKSLATPTSRRQALKTLAMTTFGGFLAFSGLGTAFAKKKCSPGLTNCGGKCVDTKTDPHNCGVCGTVCQSGLCVNGLCCPPGAVKCGNSCCSFTCCGGNTCVDIKHDVKNCGACGNVCPPGDICQNGKCISVCATGCTQLCNGTCARVCSINCCVMGCRTDVSGVDYCSVGGGSQNPCMSDCDCPKGEFCRSKGGFPNICITAACC